MTGLTANRPEVDLSSRDPDAIALAAIAIIERESAALEATDLAQATALVADKQRALAALDQVATPDALSRETLERLRDAAVANRLLLRRALAVQGEVIRLVASACQPQTARYGARGAPATDRAVAPRAFLARA